LAAKLEVEPQIPWLAKRQMHRDNQPAKTTEEYYRRSLAIPLVDHLISHMETNFSKLTKKATKLLFLVPSLICDINIDKTVFEDAINLYCDDLPNENVVDIEIRMWKRKWCAVAPEQRPDSVAKALKLCDQENFPNLFVLLKLVATFPVISCEWSFLCSAGCVATCEQA
jgi:hypothetical protein